MSVVFTERELDIMAVLWDRGPSTASEVRDALGERGLDLAYNTVLTLLRILEDKGHVDHTEENRSHRYRPLVDREEASASALSRTLHRLFAGSAEALVTQLVQQRELSSEDLKRLRQIVDEELDSKVAKERTRSKGRRSK
jgi:BlaI family transcriptional regulator, penicillinase repressor